MGILDNLENAWDEDFSFESKPMSEIDNLGNDKIWGESEKPENDGLALKMFKEACCDQCQCEDTGPWKD